MRVGVRIGVNIVESRCRRNLASFAASERAMYSASIVDSATVDCLTDCQEIGPLARKKMYPE